MHTVVETPTYVKASTSLFSDSEQEDVIHAIAFDPEAGDVMPGTGGYRKLRFGRQGMGKRSGARVIYLYGSLTLPIFLITAYAKNEKSLSKAQQNVLKKAAAQFFMEYGGA